MPGHEKWEPMYKQGGLPHDTTPMARQQTPSVEESVAALGELHDRHGFGPTDGPNTPAPEVIVRYRYGPFALALAAVTAALIATTLAIWVDVNGCNCPAPPPTVAPPAVAQP